MSVTVSQLIGKVSIEGVETAKRQLSDVHSHVEKTSSGFKDMLKNALSFAGGQAIFNAVGNSLGFLKDQMVDVVKAGMDQAALNAQTVAALKSTHNAAGMTADAIGNLADSYSHLTTFSDDTIQSAENMLLTFTNIGKNVFPQATKTVLDMSQALGQDTKSSAIELGKALNDPLTGITALQRVGVTFDTKQKDLIKTYMAHNQVAKAQAIILQELQKEFGGSAEAAGTTFGGQMKILGNIIDQAKEKIGTALLPVLAKFGDFIAKNIVPALIKFADFLSSPAFIKFAGLIGDKVIGSLKLLGQFLTPIITSFMNMGKFITPLIAQFSNWAEKNHIVSLAMGLVNTVTKTLSDIFAQLSKDFGPLIQQFIVWADKNHVVEGAIQALKIGVQFLGEVIKFASPIIASMVAQLGKFATEIFTRLQPILTNLAKWWKTNWPQFKLIFEGTWTAIGGILKIAWSLISGIIKVGLDLLSGNWSQAWTDMKEMFTGIWDGIKQYLQGALKFLVGLFHPLLEAIAGIPGPIGDMAKSVLKNFDNMNKGSQQSVLEMKAATLYHTAQLAIAATQNYEYMRQQLIAKMKDTKDKTVQHALDMKIKTIEHLEEMQRQAAIKASNMADKVTQQAKNMKDDMVGNSIIPDMVGGVLDWLGRMASGASAPIKAFSNNIIDMLNNGIRGFNDFTGGVRSAVNSVAKAFGMDNVVPAISIDLIPHYARGTRGHRGGPAIVGEEGPEMVILPAGSAVLSHPQTMEALRHSQHRKGVPNYAAGTDNSNILMEVIGWLSGGASSMLDHIMGDMGIKIPHLSGVMGQIAGAMVNKTKDFVLHWINNLFSNPTSGMFAMVPGLGGTKGGNWLNYPQNIFYGNPNQDANLGGAHDIDLQAPFDTPITSILGGIVSDVSYPSWGAQVGIQLAQPYRGAPYMAFLHLDAVNPMLRVGMPIAPGTLVGWSGGANNWGQVTANNPTGTHFLNTSYMSSGPQIGIALMYGPRYGSGAGFPGISGNLDPMPLIRAARGFARGTSSAPGGWSWVGEEGPELRYVRQGTKILSHGQSMQAMQQPIQVHVDVHLDGARTTRQLMPHITQAIRRATSNRRI
jgi:hypothetical protein